MGMKGISPVIASVLLIGITVAVGVMLSSWVTHWVDVRTQQASSACVTSTNYKVDSVTFSYATNNMTIVVTNHGSIDLYGFSVELMNGTEVSLYNSSDSRFRISPNITQANPLRQQRTAVISLDMGGDYESSLAITADRIKILNSACPAFPAETSTITKE